MNRMQLKLLAYIQAVLIIATYRFCWPVISVGSKTGAFRV